MDAQKRYPKPPVLEADPNTADAAKQFLHWKRSLENYLGRIFKDDNSTPDDLEALKLEYLTTLVDYKNFDYISDSTKYQDAMKYSRNSLSNPRMRFLPAIICKAKARRIIG